MDEEKEPIKEGFKAGVKKNLPGFLTGFISALTILIITLIVNGKKDSFLAASSKMLIRGKSLLRHLVNSGKIFASCPFLHLVNSGKDEHADLARGLMLSCNSFT
jgi:hypothetical protein